MYSMYIIDILCIIHYTYLTLYIIHTLHYMYIYYHYIVIVIHYIFVLYFYTLHYIHTYTYIYTTFTLHLHYIKHYIMYDHPLRPHFILSFISFVLHISSFCICLFGQLGSALRSNLHSNHPHPPPLKDQSPLTQTNRHVGRMGSHY